MTKNQINQKEMLDVVLDFLDTNVSKWTAIPILGTLKNELDSIGTDIHAAHQTQESAQVFLGKTKAKLKHTIAEKADIINDVIETFAMINGNAELELRMNQTLGQLYKMRNEDFVPKIQEIVTEAENNKVALTTDYGLTEEQITDLKADLDAFLVMRGQPRAYRISASTATKDLNQLFDDMSATLDKLDQVMKIFKRRDVNFYNGYTASRIIVD